jgi:hypothetical protein
LTERCEALAGAQVMGVAMIGGRLHGRARLCMHHGKRHAGSTSDYQESDGRNATQCCCCHCPSRRTVGEVDTMFKFVGPDHKIVVDATIPSAA